MSVSNVYPLKPHFYIVILGYAGIYLPVTKIPQCMFCSKNKKKKSTENFQFLLLKNLCILPHGRVFIMLKFQVSCDALTVDYSRIC